ncbi:MAG: hypothetical protein FWE76_07690 [Symbiobacteriaceae bacterium]|nr:hypothetical protein [Symbiobacteriaceae bacterium]
MPIKWFSATRSNAGVPSSDPCRIVFTNKPKGIRVNSTMTRAILEMGKKYMRIGFDETKKVIYLKPVDTSQEAFKFVTNKNSGQICSALIWSWFTEKGLQLAHLSGQWDEDQKAFVFDWSKK